MTKVSDLNSFRDILYKWVVIKDWKQYPDLKYLLKDYNFSHLFGFIYIDHECGLTLDVIKVFNGKDGKISSFANLREVGLRTLTRYESFSNYEFKILTEKQVKEYSLPEQNKIIEIYSSIEYEKMRAREGLDPFRSDAYPDDIQVLLFSINDLQPEQVWCRMESMTEEENYNIYNCKLLNQPYQNFKVNVSEMVEVIYSQTPYGTHMVCKTSLDRLKEG